MDSKIEKLNKLRSLFVILNMKAQTSINQEVKTEWIEAHKLIDSLEDEINNQKTKSNDKQRLLHTKRRKKLGNV